MDILSAFDTIQFPPHPRDFKLTVEEAVGEVASYATMRLDIDPLYAMLGRFHERGIYFRNIAEGRDAVPQYLRSADLFNEEMNRIEGYDGHGMLAGVDAGGGNSNWDGARGYSKNGEYDNRLGGYNNSNVERGHDYYMNTNTGDANRPLTPRYSLNVPSGMGDHDNNISSVPATTAAAETSFGDVDPDSAFARVHGIDSESIDDDELANGETRVDPGIANHNANTVASCNSYSVSTRGPAGVGKVNHRNPSASASGMSFSWAGRGGGDHQGGGGGGDWSYSSRNGGNSNTNSHSSSLQRMNGGRLAYGDGGSNLSAYEVVDDAEYV
jgi:hypothetical protein